jgi:putative acetyltransferase
LNSPYLIVRDATLNDAPAVAALFRQVRRASLPFLPNLHSAGEDAAFFKDTVFARSSVLVAEAVAIVGFVAWRPGWVDHLYVHPGHARQGIGSALLARALDGQRRVELWAFRRNTPALAFYRRHGFRVVRETDGSGNEEKEPDVLMAWERDQSAE